MTRLEDLQIAIKECGATVSDDDMLVSLLNGMHTEEATIRAVVKGDPTVTTFELAKAKIRTVQDHIIKEPPAKELGALSFHMALLASATPELPPMPTDAWSVMPTSRRTMIRAAPPPPLSSHNPFGSLTFSDDTADPNDEPTLLEEREMRDAIAAVSVEEQAIAAAVAAVAEEEAAERAAIAGVAAFIAADPVAMTVARTSKAIILPNDVAMRRAIITNDPTPWHVDWLHSAAHRSGKAPVPMPTVTHVVPASRFNASTSSGM
eukprot:jgi/Tetstr1/458819/TSEL_045203.t1